jgi:hypothetical protein
LKDKLLKKLLDKFIIDKLKDLLNEKNVFELWAKGKIIKEVSVYAKILENYASHL